MNKLLTIGILALIVVLLIAYRKKLLLLVAKPVKATPPATVATTTLPASLDRNKVLKKGVTGPEVGYLQKILGVKQDNVFGPITEAALQDTKCVSEVTLNTYDLQTCETPGVDEDILGFHGDWSMGDNVILSLDNLQF